MKNDFLEELDKKVNRLLELIEPKISKYTFADWVFLWLEKYRGEVSFETILKDIHNAKTLCLTFGKINICKITSSDIQAYLNGISKQRQRLHYFQLLRNCFNCAIRLGELVKNPCNNVVIKYWSEETKVFSDIELEKFFCVARQSFLYDAFFVLSREGFRPSEMLALYPNNLRDDFIEIKSSWDNRKKILGKCKTKTSVREVPYFETKDILQAIAKKNGTGRLFPYQLRTLEDEFKKVVKSVENTPRDYTLYSLRHTCITNWAKKNVHIKVAKKWAGHSSISTTLKYYTHISVEWEKIEQNKTFSEVPT